MRAKASQPGYTLVELLVTIGIIVILLAIVAPITIAIRHSAVRTRCASNVHQVFVSLASYAADNNGEIPAVYGPDTTKPHPMAWFNIGVHDEGNGNGGLMLLCDKPIGMANHGYLKDLDIFDCPGDPEVKLKRSSSYLYCYVPNGGSTYVPWWYHPPASTTQPNKSYTLVPNEFSGFERHNLKQKNATSTAILIEASVIHPIEYGWRKYHGKGGHVLFLDGHVTYGSIDFTNDQRQDGKYMMTAVDQLANSE
jgi:prepilin-type N-terminal cleavage/methylation domain-containing protein/prepilin-type processing-associated H-X9-DG protein